MREYDFRLAKKRLCSQRDTVQQPLSDAIAITIANHDGDVRNFLSLSPSQYLKHLDGLTQAASDYLWAKSSTYCFHKPVSGKK
ncbi:hypothetical protein LCGC14_1657530, partial [marine sediment metagenome]